MNNEWRNKMQKCARVLGQHAADVRELLEVTWEALKGRLPLSPGTVALLLAAVAYFISPIDAVPDWLPGGLIDDAAVALAALAKVRPIIARFRVIE